MYNVMSRCKQSTKLRIVRPVFSIVEKRNREEAGCDTAS